MKLTKDLQAKLLEHLGYDKETMIAIYNDFSRSKYAFERHFVEDEPLERDLMNEVKEQFTLYNTVVLFTKEES